MQKWVRSLVFSVSTLMASAGLQAAAAGAPSAAAPAPAANASASGASGGASVATGRVFAEYILQPFDLIKVEVFRQPTLLAERRLSQDSTVSLSLLGSISLRGKTVLEAENLIRDLYNKDYLVDPQVSVTVIEYAKREVQLLGHVASPGAVTISPDRPLRILDAIAAVGGTTRLAQRNKVTLTRRIADGKTETTTIDLDAIVASRAENILLQNGDVINVPERIF